MAKIKVNLSTSSIQDAIKKLQQVKKDLSNINDVVCEEMAKQTSEVVKKGYDNLPYSSTSGNDPVQITYTKSNKGWKVVASGEGVVYEEFGTGDVGERHPHPIPPTSLGLNDYNTGATIRETSKLSPDFMKNLGLSNGKYWTYYDAEGKVYTQGIPAGKFMYKGSVWLRKNYQKIAKKKVNDVLSKL